MTSFTHFLVNSYLLSWTSACDESSLMTVKRPGAQKEYSFQSNYYNIIIIIIIVMFLYM